MTPLYNTFPVTMLMQDIVDKIPSENLFLNKFKIAGGWPILSQCLKLFRA